MIAGLGAFFSCRVDNHASYGIDHEGLETLVCIRVIDLPAVRSDDPTYNLIIPDWQTDTLLDGWIRDDAHRPGPPGAAGGSAGPPKRITRPDEM
jgi:hypothetical protein